MIRTGNKKLSLAQYMGSLSIVGAGEVTWDQIVDAGYNTVEKIDAMSVQDIACIGGSDSKKIGEKTAQKIWSCLHSDEIKDLLKYSNLWVEDKPTEEDFLAAVKRMETPGQHPDKISFITEGDTSLKDISISMRDQVTIRDSLKIETEESELKIDLKGKKVLFTGKYIYSRQTLSSILKRNGAILKSSITKSLDILICADLNSNSNKAKKARKWGIRMITYEDVFGV